MRRLTWLLFLCGLALRCVALHQPLVDAGLLRQCQTAAVTRDLSANGGVSSPIPWAGDLDERFVLELPLYNYLVAGVAALTGQLVVSGKIVSIAFWVVSFWLLQDIWRRLVPPKAINWANLLFVTSPLSVFYAQAFMLEMLVQAVALAFVLALIRYDENSSLSRWWVAVPIGLLALLLKSTITAHLYVILLLLIAHREGWRGFFRPRYLLAGVLTGVCVMAWGKYLDSVNVTPLSFGGSGANLKGFIGPWQLRVQWRTWWKIALYLAGFLAPGFAVAAIVTGLPVVLRERPRLLIAWLLSLVVFYLLWLGNGPASQGYYNLPALVPCAALFALGVDAFLRAKVLRDWTRTASVVVVVATIASAAPIWKYLFMQDRTILAAALWARNHTEPSALILLRAAHRADMKDYPPDAVFPFYAERRALTWTEGIPEPYRTAGLERALYAVVTLPQTEGKVMTFIRKLRGLPTPPPESIDWLRALGFSPIAEQPEFIALRRP